MGYFDYSAPTVPDLGEAIKPIGDALTEVMRRRQQDQQFQEKMKFDREQEQRKFDQAKMNYDYQNRIIAQREQRDQREFQQRQNVYRSGQADKARHAATPQEAQSILDETVLYGPDGKESGRGKLTAGPMRDVGAEPLEPMQPELPAAEMGAAIPDVIQAIPGMPPELAARLRGKKRPEPEEGAMVGPIPAAEELRHAEIQRMGSEPPSADETDVEGRLSAAEAERQSQEAKLRRYGEQYEAYRHEEPTLERANAAVDAYDADVGRFNEEKQSLPGRRAEFAAASRQAELERPYTISFGQGQPETTFDFKTQRYAAREQNAQDFLNSLPPNMSPQDQEAARAAYGAIIAGQDPKAVLSAYQKERVGLQGQGFKHGEGLLRDAAALERAKVPRPGVVLQERRLGFEGDKEKAKNLRTDLKTFAERYGAKTIQEDNLQIPRIVKDLSGNAQQQRNAMVQLWQMAQHDHRFSDKDAVMAQTVDPSWLAKISNWVSLGTTGQLDPEVQAEAVQTAKSFGSYLSTKSAQMRDMAKRDFIDSGLYDPHEADVLLGQQVPGWQRQFADGGGPPEVNARRKGKAAAVSRKVKAPSVDEALKALEGM